MSWLGLKDLNSRNSAGATQASEHLASEKRAESDCKAVQRREAWGFVTLELFFKRSSRDKK
jgi:hypothetical protein